MRRWVIGTSIVLCALAAIYSFFDFGRVNEYTASMMPTIVPGEYYALLRTQHIKRFDIVVLDDPASDELLIKRVVGLSGDMIQLKNGVLFINEFPLTESYLKEEWRGHETYPAFLLAVPEDYYFVLGDNREASRDSRSFGVVQKKAIHGKIIFTYWPWENGKIFW